MDPDFAERLKYLEELSKGIEDTWRTRDFTDVELVVENQSYHCHRIILASMSHYFSAMFSSGFRETNEEKITLNGIEKRTFEEILLFIYTGKNVVGKNNVYQLMVASIMFQIPSLTRICDAFLNRNLSADNIIGIWRLACSYGLQELEKACWRFITQRFPEVSTGEEFRILTIDELFKIVNDKKLNTSSEELVCDAVLNWVKGEDSENRKTQLPDIWKCLPFSSMSSDYLQSLCKNELLQNPPLFLDIINAAITDEDSGIDREEMREVDVLCMVGTRSRHPDPQKTEVRCYSAQHNMSFALSNLPKEPGPCFAVCTDGKDVFISGGYVEKKLMFHFQSHNNRWEVAELSGGRWSHGMVHVKGSIYIVGGMSSTNDTLSCIEKFNPAEKTSEVVGALEIAVSSMIVSVLGQKIYVFGGKLRDRRPATAIQCYDTRTDTCTIVGEIPASCSGLVGRAAEIENSICIVFRNGCVLEFTEDEGISEVCNTEKFDYFGAAEMDQKVLILGTQSSCFKCFVYDPMKKEARIEPVPFKAAMCNFHCLKLVLNKRYLWRNGSS